jgi:probable phosphoglycerate mutase
MAIIYLMRHGAVDNPRDVFYGPDQPLSDEGRHQVVRTLERMCEAGVEPVAVIASPYLRTRQTAELAAQAFGGVPLSFDDRLHEWNVDGWFGRPFDEFYRHVGWIDGAIVTDFPPDIEPYPDLARRVSAALRAAMAAYPHGPILCVSHGEPIACVAASLQGRPWHTVRTEQIHLAEVWRSELSADGTNAQVSRAFGPS